MTETFITFNNAILLSTVCLSSGVIIGAALYAYISDSWVEREPQIDADELQRELDEAFVTPAEVKAARMI
jgi:uncharacterized protein YneF (UPF0154 family)